MAPPRCRGWRSLPARGRVTNVAWGAGNNVSYTFNARGERVSKGGTGVPTGTRYFVYDEAGRVLGEYHASGLNWMEYVWLEDRPIAVNRAVETVVDNASATEVSVTGTWTSATTPVGFYETNYAWHAPGGGASYTFRPAVPSAGTYLVQARWVAGTDRATNAPFTVNHTGGSTTVRVNQRVNNNTWVSLGTFTLDANSTITLTDDADGLVIADAVKIFPGTAGTLRYVQSDHLGTPRAVIDAAKHLRWRWEADPFGSIPPDNNPEGFGAYEFNLRFPGQYFDKETGLHYNYFRDYDPSVGRYVQSDPIGLKGGINTYGYVGSNTLGYVDPTGEAAQAALVPFCIANPVACVVGGVGIALASPPGQRALAKAATAVRDFCKPDDQCGPDTREQAMAKAIAFAGIPPDGGNCDPIPWSDYNNKGRNYADIRRNNLAPCMGYRGPAGKPKIEDHPDGHDDENQPHHQCPHIHATNASGQTTIFRYKRSY